MKCFHCSKEAVYDLRTSGHSLCKKHFTNLFESRIKKTIRQNSFLTDPNNVIVPITGSVNGMVVLSILSDIMGVNPKAKLKAALMADHDIIREYIESKKIDCVSCDGGELEDLAKQLGSAQIAYTETLDDLAEQSLKEFIQEARRTKKQMNILAEITVNEIQLYAKIKKIPHIRGATNPGKIQGIIGKLEQNHPSIKHQIQKSKNELKDLY